MELSSILFAFCLLSAGIWLIFTINGDFKEKQRQGQRLAASAPVKRLPAARPAAATARAATGRAMTNARQLSPAPTVESPRAAVAPAKVEQAGAIDPFQLLNTAVMRETFERFTREL
ncbi:MAG: hypothetical protein QOF02_4017 [Blastocatellia bacterium]|jgi:hypothetical protein|nr:hypothetical protein [Blastocatellia bacterium]